MSEFVLFGVIIVLAGLLYLRERENRLERAKLVNALMSKNATELRDLEFVDKVTLPKVTPVEDPLTATADMSDEEFDKHIEEQLKNG